MTGTVSAAAFAAVHGLDKIPIGQFTGGIWFWYLMKHRGISHAMLAHAANNHVGATVLVIGNMLHGSAILGDLKVARTGASPAAACDRALGGFVDRWARVKTRAKRG